MQTEQSIREHMFWGGISLGNIYFLFHQIQFSEDFARQIEAQITEAEKEQVQKMIQKQFYISSAFSSTFFNNCATWIKATKLLNGELVWNKKTKVHYFITLAQKHVREGVTINYVEAVERLIEDCLC